MKKLLVVAMMAMPVAAYADIQGSKHNFYTNPDATSADGQICKYCHTPHKANSTRGIWNHTASSATYSYSDNATAKSWEGTPLMTTINAAQYSATCLGCHDGTVALGDLSNAGGGSAGVATFTGPDVDSATGKLNGGPGLVVKSGTTDLMGNHPIGVPYAGQTYFGRASAIPATEIGAAGGYWPQAKGVTQPSGSNTMGISLAADRTVSGTGAAPTYGVECSTCHNPHNTEGNPYMLRVTPTESGICRSCHMK